MTRSAREEEIKIRREKGVNVFEFPVRDASQAFAAVLDVPRLFSTGHLRSRRVNGGGDKWVNFLEVFIISGFPSTDRYGQFAPEMIAGIHGQVGATYVHSFPASVEGKETITVRTEVREIIDLATSKCVVFKHTSAGNGIEPIHMDCFRNPQIPPPETETRVMLTEVENGQWKMKLTYNGMNAFDPREREGSMNYYMLVCSIAFVLPCSWPCLPFLVWTDFSEAPAAVRQQIERVRDYCNSYEPGPPPVIRHLPTAREAEGFEENGPTRESSVRVAKRVQVSDERKNSAHQQYAVALPVDKRASGEQPTELERLLELYEEGSISLEEYEAQKMKILTDAL